MKLGVPSEEGQLSMMFARGGPREGAGRKGIGVTKKLSLTLPQETWDRLEALSIGSNCSRSELLRTIVEFFLAESVGDSDKTGTANASDATDGKER